MQLDRIMQSQGFGSRRECRGMVRRGRVAVDGAVCEDPFAEYEPEGFEFTVDGVAWPWHAFASLVMNKPTGYECSRKPQHHPSVLSLLPVPLQVRGVQPVGRLDEDTTGLLILTDDGQLNHRLSSPKKKLPKVYHATCRHPIDEAMLAALLAGVTLHDEPEPIAAAGAEAIDEHRLRLTLREGKYHQVKRMVAAAGNRVDALERVSIGGLTLPADLPPGEWRWLSQADVDRLTRADDE
jgi:16S rRNA pseudouridine516 synthase